MHFFASTFHESTPVALLSSKGSKLRSPFVMAPVPHFGTHFRHELQNSVMPKSTAPAASSSASAAEERRARELAALGIGPAPSAETPTDEPRPLARDNNVNADLLARLIDGVKGA